MGQVKISGTTNQPKDVAEIALELCTCPCHSSNLGLQSECKECSRITALIREGLAGALELRLWDLVRYQRMELHAANLITDEEYQRLLSDDKSVARLASYDQLQRSLSALREKAGTLMVDIEHMAPLAPSTKAREALAEELRKQVPEALLLNKTKEERSTDDSPT